jgi:SAM-dependent methyltransferase
VSADMKKPGKSDPSRPREDGYEYKRDFYRSTQVAEDYDFHRFGSPERQKRNARKWAAIRKALASTSGVRTLLDLPCGTGRFTGALAREGYEIIGSDISMEMLQKAADMDVGVQANGQRPAIRGYLQANAERLPLRDDSFDCVVCIRFMMHVDPATRVRMLREFRRVSRRWVIVDYRHKYSFRYLITHTVGKLGLGRAPLARVSRADLEQELRDAGFAIREVVRVSTPLLSDKWVVLAERM